MIRKVWNTVFDDTFRKVEQEGALVFDKKTVWVLTTSAVCLMAINYLGSIQTMQGMLHGLGLHTLSRSLGELYTQSSDAQLVRLCFWASVSFVFYFIIPVIIIKLVLKESLRAYGMGLKGMVAGYRVYILFFIIMLPLIWWVSHNASFQLRYPFYKPSSTNPDWSHLMLWEGFYFLQFAGLEFFFRGFMVHGTKHRFGFYAIWVMMVPYCMIHFGKPWQETTGAIMAGIALGALSLKSNSVWLGVAIHFSVAIAMDVLSLYQKGFFT